MCRFFQQSKPCPLGVRCHYAHGKNELRKLNDTLPVTAPIITAPKIDAAEDQPAQGEQTVGLHNYKTVMCKYWEQGKCKYQQKCSFAHGDPEMRNPESNFVTLPQNAIVDPLKNTAFEYYLRFKQLMLIQEQLAKRYVEDPSRMSFLS